MTEKRSNLSYLDLNSFDIGAAKAIKEVNDKTYKDVSWRETVISLACQVRSLIQAIRYDGLDPRWNPEVDALDGLFVRGTLQAQGSPKYQIRLGRDDAQDIVNYLHKNGYKIIKEAA